MPRKFKRLGIGKGRPGGHRRSPKTKLSPEKSLDELAKETANPLAVEPGGQLETALSPKSKVKQKVVTLEAPKSDSYDYLRFSAGLAYTTDLNGVSVEELSKRPPFQGVVSFEAMRNWCHQDLWVARREALAAEWRRNIEAKMGQRVVQQALVDLENADRFLLENIRLLEVKAGKVNSYEGLVNSTVRLMEFRASLRSQVMSAVMPTMVSTGNQGKAMPTPKLSAEDARAAATAILKRRREEIRAEQEKKAEPEPEKAPETPALRLLPGQKT